MASIPSRNEILELLELDRIDSTIIDEIRRLWTIEDLAKLRPLKHVGVVTEEGEWRITHTLRCDPQDCYMDRLPPLSGTYIESTTLHVGAWQISS